MDHIADLESAAAAFSSVLEATTPERFTLPTPCTDWDVREVVVHVVGGTWRSVASLRGEPEPDRSIDPLGDDALGAFKERYANFLTEVTRPEFGASNHQHPRFGPINGGQLVLMRANEYLAHSWDIAVATGQRIELPRGVALHSIELFEGLKKSVGGNLSPAYAPAQPTEANAETIDRYIAYFGRSPDWKPPAPRA